MKRIALVWVVVLVAQGLALADGCLMPSEQSWQQRRERALINEPEQKAVVFFSRGTEQLIISPSYEGPSASFAWVVPVPARPKVEILKGAIFHELSKLTEPKPPVLKGPAPMAAGVSPETKSVKVLERKTVGAYDVSVLEATDGQALMKWLKANKYHLPDKAADPIKGYVKQGWTFVASRIRVPANAKGLHTGTLAPIRLTFRAERPVYPLKLSSANPDTFMLLVYLVLPSDEIEGKPESISCGSDPEWLHKHGTPWRATASGYPWRRRDYPTLAKLYNGEMQVYSVSRAVGPGECTADAVWTIPRRKG